MIKDWLCFILALFKRFEEPKNQTTVLDNLIKLYLYSWTFVKRVILIFHRGNIMIEAWLEEIIHLKIITFYYSNSNYTYK